MTFQKSWRAYQARLLDGLNNFLDNGRLHVVAAPGSGKTVFGIEVARRLNQPTLVLAPTLTIRDQWVDRLIQHFLPANQLPPDWISIELRKPELFTVVTYQALHAMCTGDRENEQPVPAEEENGNTLSLAEDANGYTKARKVIIPEALGTFKTLLVDEAHHLKAEWWRTLSELTNTLKPTVVALTATPPYDVPPHEWERYEELCGPVDAEIAVPELVQQGDLCPHQDYVYLSTPDRAEEKTLAEFRLAVNAFVARLRSNQPFVSAVSRNPWVTSPDAHIEEILEDPEYLSSMVIFLHAVGQEIQKEVLNALGTTSEKIPGLELNWLEILLTRCLYVSSEHFVHIEPELKKIRHELLSIGAIERRKVVLQNPSDHTKLLTSSKTKLKSIEEIVRLEAGSQQNALRCVVLTDFIRKAEFPNNADETPVFEDIGVVPIFETLRRAGLAGVRMGVLCGSLVIVPASAALMVQETARAMGIRSEDLSMEALQHDPGYIAIGLSGEYRQGIVRLVTAVFEQGGIHVLIGTKALLGEGWDAPCINTLVLASFVGSYVLSNQMRGRSIRVDSRRPNKTANVWHLVCVEPGVFGPGPDYELLIRRCSAFVGVSAVSARIENGVDRLGLEKPPYSREQIAELNERTCRRALDREVLRRLWSEALESGQLKKMTDGLKTDQEALPRGFVLSNTIAVLLTQTMFLFVTVFSELMNRSYRFRSGDDFLKLLVIVAAIAAAVSLPMALQAVWRLLRHGTPERSMRQVGAAVLHALEFEGSLNTHAAEFRVYADRNQDGSVYCWLGGGTGREQALYLRTLRELFKPIDNPRYLLARHRIWRFFREDYYPVPELLARKKAFAEAFASQWKRHVGPVELVYTRSAEGRRLLLRARMHSLSGAFQKRSERLSCWQ